MSEEWFQFCFLFVVGLVTLGACGLLGPYVLVREGDGKAVAIIGGVFLVIAAAVSAAMYFNPPPGFTW